MSRRQTWLILSAPTLLFTLQAKAANAPDALTADQRLAKPIRVMLKDVPVSVLLPQLTKATGVPLLWDKEISDLRASVFLQSQPASRVLIYLATCLRLAWRSEADGYRLYRLAAITRNDERQRREWEEARAKKIEEQRQLDEFTAALLQQSYLSDEEVRKLVARFPYVAKTVEENPWFIVGLRVVTWLTPEQWDKALINRLRLDYKEWTLTGPDPDLPVPVIDPETAKLIAENLRREGKEPGRIAIEKPLGRSGIDSVFVGVLPNGRLGISVDYVVPERFGQSMDFILGSVRNRR